jgi:hypothetical protein
MALGFLITVRGVPLSATEYHQVVLGLGNRASAVHRVSPSALKSCIQAKSGMAMSIE